MKTLKYKTAKTLSKQVEQLTLYDLMRGRAHHKTHGWVAIDVENRNKEIEACALLIGGRKTASIGYILKSKTFHHYVLDRIIFSNTLGAWEYVPGQCEDIELAEFRKFLYAM